MAALLPVAPIRRQYKYLNIIIIYVLRVCSSSGQSPERWLDGTVSNPIIRYHYDHEGLWCFYLFNLIFVSLGISETETTPLSAVRGRNGHWTVLSLHLRVARVWGRV